MILVTTTTTVTPDAAANPEATVQPSMAWTWTAPWLDRTWEITDPTSPVVKLDGAQGIGQADPTHWWSEAPTIDGAAWEGHRVDRGTVFIPVMVQGNSYDEFESEHTAFMRTLDPRREGVLRVTRPNGKWRQIGCRYESGATSMTTDYDVTASLLATYGLTWATADPYWQGEEVSARFVNETAAAFFPGPPFRLGAGQTLANSKITNPGDVDSHALWRVEGPFTSFSVGVGDSLVEMTLTKAAGGFIEIDMQPRKLTITDENGVDRWDDVTEVDFSAIPPGVTDLSTVLNGTGAGSAVTLTFTPRYRRAW